MTIVTDRIGNTLHRGQLLLHIPSGLIYEVMEVNSGGVFFPDSDKKTPGMLVLKIQLPFNSAETHAMYKDFVVVVNPADQAAVKEFLDKSERSKGDGRQI